MKNESRFKCPQCGGDCFCFLPRYVTCEDCAYEMVNEIEAKDEKELECPSCDSQNFFYSYDYAKSPHPQLIKCMECGHVILGEKEIKDEKE